VKKEKQKKYRGNNAYQRQKKNKGGGGFLYGGDGHQTQLQEKKSCGGQRTSGGWRAEPGENLMGKNAETGARGTGFTRAAVCAGGVPLGGGKYSPKGKKNEKRRPETHHPQGKI